MSHQTPADATASSTSTNQIRRLTNSFGLLSYQQQGSKEIRELPHVPGSTGTNVCDLVFSYKLQFCQFLGHSKCTVTYLPGNYRDAELVNENFDDFVLSLNVNDPQVDFSGDETIARSFPLAKSVLFFSRVIIRLDFAQFEPKQKDKYACRLNLVHLTSGNVTQLPESDERVFMDQMRRLSDAETAAQEKLVGKQEDCLLKTFAWNKTILVAISPRFNENNANFEGMYKQFSNIHLTRLVLSCIDSNI